MASRPPQEEDPRVALAVERTFLAWIRTGLAMMGFGFVVARFGLFMRELTLARGAATSPGLSMWAGVALVGLGVGVNVAAAVRHVRTMRRLGAGEPTGAGATQLSLIVASLLAAVGIFMAIYLVVTR